MKIKLKFSMKSYLKFSSILVVRAQWALGGGVHPTSKDGSSPWPRLAKLLADCRALGPHVATVKNPKMSSKRRTDLKIWPSKAKNLEELDFDVRKSLAPPKSIKNDEKLNSEIVKNSDFLFSFFWRFWYCQGSFKAEILTTGSSRRPRASEKFSK